MRATALIRSWRILIPITLLALGTLTIGGCAEPSPTYLSCKASNEDLLNVWGSQLSELLDQPIYDTFGCDSGEPRYVTFKPSEPLDLNVLATSPSCEVSSATPAHCRQGNEQWSIWREDGSTVIYTTLASDAPN